MEIGAVIAAAPRSAVIRENSDPGDVIILLGGRTGRDGIGGATGSSKGHTEESTLVCGAEVQKGNAPTERKLQRLFRRTDAAHLIKKCNDFGAGGVSVAIGELARGLDIDLDKVPKRNMPVSTARRSPSPSLRREWLLLSIRRTQSSSWTMPVRKNLRIGHRGHSHEVPETCHALEGKDNCRYLPRFP